MFGIPAKWLIIGGGAGGGVLLVVIVVVVLFVTGIIGGAAGGASGGAGVLGYIPASAGVVAIVDNEAILNGDVPDDYLEYIEDESEDAGDFGVSSVIYEKIDIDDDDISLLAGVSDQRNADTLEIVRGDFDFNVIREELEDGLDCEDDDYRGFELWECPGEDFPAVALFEKDGYVVFAVERQDDLEDMLTYKSRAPEKLADDGSSDIKRILDQIDGGWLQIVVFLDDCAINRCQGIAFALGESDDSEAIPASYAVMFSSERAASGAESDVEIDDLLETMFAGAALDLDIGEVKAEGEFVVGTGEAEFVDPDDVRSSTRDGGRAQPVRAEPEQPAATQAPRVSRIDWIEQCYYRSSDLGRSACGCVYDYLEVEIRYYGESSVPEWDNDWESGNYDDREPLSRLGGAAVDSCY